MSCDQLDLKAYALGEASKAERKAVEGHAASCSDCRTELETLGTLQVAMRSWADEEPTRRIAFVSDKVFEPRWWQKLNWAQMLAPAALAAMAAFAVVKTQAPQSPVPVAAITAPDIEQRIAEAVSQRVDVAVKTAVAESEARQQDQAAQLVRATERRIRQESAQTMAQTMAMVDANFDRLRNRDAKFLRASADLGVR
jgi:anti-sigma factor RsiW